MSGRRSKALRRRATQLSAAERQTASSALLGVEEETPEQCYARLYKQLKRPWQRPRATKGNP